MSRSGNSKKRGIRRDVRPGMKRMERKTAAFVFAVLFLFLSALSAVEAREITDMTGRKVTVPDRIRKIYATSPPVTYMIYALDQALLAGLNAPLKEQEKKFLPQRLHSLPVLGGYFGQGQVANIEMIMKVNPDVVIMWMSQDTAVNRKMETDMKNLGIPLVYMEGDRVEEYGRGLKFLGRLTNREERAKKLAAYGENVLKEVAAVTRAIPPGKRVSVYYAEGPDGLYTECHTSRHAELINLVGAENVHRCRTKSSFGMEKISLEKVLLHNPEVIFIQERDFYNRIKTDPRWRRVRAVRNGRVFIIPKAPFNWFDRPPSYMRYLGVKWVMNCLYPHLYHIDMIVEMKAFYRLFLGIELTDEQCRNVLSG